MTQPDSPPPQSTPPQPGPNDRGPSDRGPGSRFAVLLVLVFLLVIIFSLPTGGRKEHNFLQIREALREGQIAELEIYSMERRVQGEFHATEESLGSNDGEPVLAKDGRFEVIVPTDTLMTEFLYDVDQYNASEPAALIQLRVHGRPNAYWLTILQILPWLLFGGIVLFFIWRSQKMNASGGAQGFGRSRARLAGGPSSVLFRDVAGVEEAKEEVSEVIEFLRDPDRFRRLGGRIPRGVLLVGPPGTGKTLLARAVAGEAGVPFFSLSGSDFVEMFVGVGASRVRDLFKQAREEAPCIVFLDEIDAVGRRRGNSSLGGSEEREQTLNAILVEMDGFDSDSGVILMAATNRPDVLDPALLRPGRFDREISVDLADMKGRLEILGVHTRNVPLASDLELEQVARGTPGFSGADLAALVNEGAIVAALEGKDQVSLVHLEEARDKVRWGRAKKSRILDDDDRRITAYHEAGHAILAHLIPEVEPLHKVTIIPRGPSLGSTMQLPQRDQYHLTRSQAFGNLMVLLGGRLAEAQFCEDVSSGASNDLERVSDLARRMVCEWGMSPRVGPIVYQGQESHGEQQPGIRPLGEETRREIDKEIRRLVEKAYSEAEDLLERHAAGVQEIAEELLKCETLSGEEVAKLIGHLPVLAAR